MDSILKPACYTLSLDKNPVSNLDLDKNIQLLTLSGSNTNLSRLTLNKNINLKSLAANNNAKLLAVDIQSGNNVQLKNINLQFNPLLNCILVDNIDSAYAKSGWKKDSTAFYRIICDDDDNDGVPNNEDQCPGTPMGDKVDIFGCSIFMLPADNFTVMATNETCRSSDNGKINITAVKTENYKATIEVDGEVLEYNFTNSVEIRDLRAGTYQFCLTVNGQPTYLNCYTIIIKQPIDLAVVRRMNPGMGELTLELSGGTNYTIELNGEMFKTSNSSISLRLSNGVNKIKVETDKVCQGKFEEEIFFREGLAYYPNPFSDQFTIYIGKEISKKARINIYSWSGQLVLSKIKPVNNGLIKLNTPNLPAGIYTISVNTDTHQHTFKMVKK